MCRILEILEKHGIKDRFTILKEINRDTKRMKEELEAWKEADKMLEEYQKN